MAPDSVNPAVILEFIQHPSHRLLATFFLGFVFITCIHVTLHVPLAIARRLFAATLGRRKKVPQGGFGLEANRPRSVEKVQGWLTGHPSTHTTSTTTLAQPTNNVTLGLTVCFAMTSIASFGSLLVFDRKTGLPGCAFLVAWGGVTGQSARLLGLLKLSLDLRKMGVRKWETYVFWVWLLVGMIAMFVSNTISIGTLEDIPNTNSALCYRKHFVATSIVTSVIDVLLEVYCLFRVYYLAVPAFLTRSHRLDAMMDVRAFRALSLLTLDLVTAAPMAHFFSVLADFIPGSIATLLVLAAFHYRSPNVMLATTASIPPTRPGSMSSHSTIEIKKTPSSRSLADPNQRISHPFAARALQDTSLETEDWPASASPDSPSDKVYLSFPEPTASAAPRAKRQTWRSSAHSGVSESDSEVARSVKGAVVGFAVRDVVGSSRRLPPMPTMTDAVRAEIFSRSTPPSARASRPIIQNVRTQRNSPSPPAPSISVTTASPISDSTESSSTPSSKPSLSIMVPSNQSTRSNSNNSNNSNNSTKSSLHLTPSTPAQQSRRTSTDSEWRYDSEASPTTQGRRQSSIMPPADDDLSIVYEASHEESDSLPPSRTYRPTFGEHMFVEGGIGRPISTPVGVPEDVQEGGQSGSNRSGSGSSGRRPIGNRI